MRAENDEVLEVEVQDTSLCQNVTPWPKPVNGANVLGDLVNAIRRHIVVRYEGALATALWIMFTYVDGFRILPMLALISPTRGCGKTQLLTLLTHAVRRPLTAANMTSAVLFRVVDEESPTLLVDEGDTFIAKDRELRGLLNAGHNRATARVHRMYKGVRKSFNVASPKAIAAIGSLPDTLMQRSVIIEMQRKAASDKVVGIDAAAEADIQRLAQKTARWAQDNASDTVDAAVTLPSGLINRAADNWTPLLAIAENVGGKWPAEARKAAVVLTRNMDTSDDAIGELLLRDLKPGVEKARGDKVIASKVMVGWLNGMDHRPWPELNRGRPITAPRMARLLKPFNIHPILIRVGRNVIRGYAPADFEDAFARYAG
jgi:hypothetical protein